MSSSDASDEPIDIDFSWEITSFTEYEVELQLFFDFPESVSSSSSEPDNLVITFWAGDIFQAKNGKLMNAGFTITAPVTRQVSIDDANFYRNCGKFAGYGALGFMILGFLAANHIGADTLPIWACYDCLVLISHLPLLNTAMPGRTSVLLSEVAKILRFTFIHAEDWHSDLDTGHGALPLSNLFMQNGYTA